MFLFSCEDANRQPVTQTTSSLKRVIDTVEINYDPPKTVKTLNDTVLTIIVSFAAISCECAQWIVGDAQSNFESPADLEHIFLVKAENKLPDADTLWDGVTLPLKLQLTGRFYREIGYPPNYKPGKGDPMPARVFRYSKLAVVRAWKGRTT
jgi:hypothetical protein